MDLYDFFPAWELKCHCGKCDYGQKDMNAVFMQRLINLRLRSAYPFRLNRAVSCPDHDKRIGGAGIHPTGHCIDIEILCQDHAQYIIFNARDHGFTGIGVKMHGPYRGRLIHLDDLPEDLPGRVRPAIWTYP